jgi:hypothetical protein
VGKVDAGQSDRTGRSDEQAATETRTAAAAKSRIAAMCDGVDDAEVVDLDLAGIDEQARQAVGVERVVIAPDEQRGALRQVKCRQLIAEREIADDVEGILCARPRVRTRSRRWRWRDPAPTR